tara:strand:- start:220 stop:393 length:174 start_codon:yes stop_codon:yes gene_type:complete
METENTFESILSYIDASLEELRGFGATDIEVSLYEIAYKHGRATALAEVKQILNQDQ